MEERQIVVPSSATLTHEEPAVLKAQVVDEIMARLAQGASVSAVAAEYGVDRKTVRAWRAKGRFQPRAPRRRVSILAPHREWLAARAPEVEYNASVLYRELRQYHGFRGSPAVVDRFVRPLRQQARPVRATVRFETPPGQQAQVDFGQRRVWVGTEPVLAHVFVFTLSFSRRVFAKAFRHERLDAVLEGHEQAFVHFGGVPQRIIVDNAKPVVLKHERHADGAGRHNVVWHPEYAAFADYYGFQPWAHWPYRPQTKGKTESGVKYVQRNALVGKRFVAWEQVNEWLLEWATTIADTRVHGTTHELPQDRFARAEHATLTPLGPRPLYHRERVMHRVVAADALVAIGGSRYSVPAQYVGATVAIRELLGSYQILHDDVVIARHTKRGRHAVVMEQQHYAGLLRPGTPRALGLPTRPPRFDPAYPASADVTVRDLAVYAAIAEAAEVTIPSSPSSEGTP